MTRGEAMPAVDPIFEFLREQLGNPEVLARWDMRRGWKASPGRIATVAGTLALIALCAGLGAWRGMF